MLAMALPALVSLAVSSTPHPALAAAANNGAAAESATASKSRAKVAPVPVPRPKPDSTADRGAETPAPQAAFPSLTQAAAPSRPPAGSLPVTLPFPSGSASLSDPLRDRLDALADSLVGNDKRVQLLAFAKAEGADAPYVARRLSLERALAVRGYLIGKGVRGTRIDVRALGANGPGPVDRVDVVGAGR